MVCAQPDISTGDPTVQSQECQLVPNIIHNRSRPVINKHRATDSGDNPNFRRLRWYPIDPLAKLPGTPNVVSYQFTQSRPHLWTGIHPSNVPIQTKHQIVKYNRPDSEEGNAPCEYRPAKQLKIPQRSRRQAIQRAATLDDAAGGPLPSRIS